LIKLSLKIGDWNIQNGFIPIHSGKVMDNKPRAVRQDHERNIYLGMSCVAPSLRKMGRPINGARRFSLNKPQTVTQNGRQVVNSVLVAPELSNRVSELQLFLKYHIIQGCRAVTKMQQQREDPLFSNCLLALAVHAVTCQVAQAQRQCNSSKPTLVPAG